ncbi:hypothetical protein HDV62DRAFT_199235 [Trichoderma sp. SZMC 28011]
MYFQVGMEWLSVVQLSGCSAFRGVCGGRREASCCSVDCLPCSFQRMWHALTVQQVSTKCTLLCEATVHTALSLPVHQVSKVVELRLRLRLQYSHSKPLDAPNSTKTTSIQHSRYRVRFWMQNRRVVELGTSRLALRPCRRPVKSPRTALSSAVGSQYRQRKGTTVPLPGPCRRLAELGPTVQFSCWQKKKVPAVRSEPHAHRHCPVRQYLAAHITRHQGPCRFSVCT